MSILVRIYSLVVSACRLDNWGVDIQSSRQLREKTVWSMNIEEVKNVSTLIFVTLPLLADTHVQSKEGPTLASCTWHACLSKEGPTLASCTWHTCPVKRRPIPCQLHMTRISVKRRPIPCQLHMTHMSCQKKAHPWHTCPAKKRPIPFQLRMTHFLSKEGAFCQRINKAVKERIVIIIIITIFCCCFFSPFFVHVDGWA